MKDKGKVRLPGANKPPRNFLLEAAVTPHTSSRSNGFDQNTAGRFIASAKMQWLNLRALLGRPKVESARQDGRPPEYTWFRSGPRGGGEFLSIRGSLCYKTCGAKSIAGSIMTNLENDFFLKRDPDVLAALCRSTVGIAGAGGLGSNVAVTLARSAVGKLIIADFDILEAPDLSRQYYFINQIGEPKVEALLENLKRLNPFSIYEIHNLKIGREDVAPIFGSADILIEAFDDADQKQMLIETWLTLFPLKPIIAASGLAGFGANERLHQRDLGSLYICGDEISECDVDLVPMAPRVAIVANMQANLAIELLVNIKTSRGS